MLDSVPATLCILAWCLLMSLGVVAIAYQRAASRTATRGARPLRGAALLPALVLAPVMVAASFSMLHVDLIYPVQMLSSHQRLILAALAPASVLVWASGLAQALARAVDEGYARWYARPFATVARAFGQEPRLVLRRVVVLEALATGWGAALPWIFSELIVVEAVFNAPGVGLAAWHAARQRDPQALVLSIACLTILYVVLATASAILSHRLGKRLETYA